MQILRQGFLIASVVVLFISIALNWTGFPKILKSAVKKQIRITPGTDVRGFWESFPFPFTFKIYVFNVTNPTEVENGDKPILKEVGPFVFTEYKDKYDIVDNEADDTVTAIARNTYFFQQNGLNGLTGEEMITIPHPLVQILSVAVQKSLPAMMPMVSKGIEILFNNSGPFLTVSFMDIFFRGIYVDCSSKQPVVRMICLQFDTGAAAGFKKINATHFTFSLMGQTNHTNAGRFTVLRGNKNSKDIGRVVQINGQKKLSVWEGLVCNSLKGTDGTVFPSYLDASEDIWTYSHDFCRSLRLRPVKKVRTLGLSAIRYEMDFGDLQNEQENGCFCESFPEECPPKGTMDLMPCTKTPLILSLPHFLRANSSLLEAVVGLNPKDSLHRTVVDFHSTTGSPLIVEKRVQFNLDAEPVDAVPGMENLRKLIMPLFWVEESITLDPSLLKDLKKIEIVHIINNFIKWVTLLLSFCGFALVGYSNSQAYRARTVARPVDVKE